MYIFVCAYVGRGGAAIMSSAVTLNTGLPDGILFRPKIAIWVNFVGSCNGHFKGIWSILYILWTFGIFCGIFFPILE
jgi:hypothetical protein